MSTAPGRGESASQHDSVHHQEATLDGGVEEGGDRQQMVIPGDSEEESHDEKTAFVNLDQFADQEPKTFTPDDEEAGYDGNTQFVDINSLMGSEEADTTGSQESGAIENDQVLTQAYQFAPGDIERGEINLIYATNSMGKAVLLRQIWSGDGQEIPTEMRERINQLDQLDLSGLLSMNGMLITETGCWVELERPPGTRLDEILEHEGPIEHDRAIDWIHQIGETIEKIHGADLVYGELTPSAIWVEREDEVRKDEAREDEEQGDEVPDDHIVLESFDLLSLENRDDLGPFGPSELKVHPDNRELSPATDVYSLAVLTLATLTGLPPEPSNAREIEDDNIQLALEEAFVDDPNERTRSIDTYLEQIGRSGGLVDIDPLQMAQNLDFKAAVGIVMLLGFGTIGVLSLMQGGGGGGGGGGEQVQAAPTQKKQAQKNDKKGSQQAAASDKRQAASGAEADAASGERDAGRSARADNTESPETTATGGAGLAPGPVDDAPRITVQTSFRDNPTEEKRPAQGIDNLDKRLETLRQKARDQIKEAEGLVDDDQKSLYQDALVAVTRSIELQGGTASKADRKLIDELFTKDEVTSYYKDLVTGIEESLEEGSVGNGKLQYQQLSSIDIDADAKDFFNEATSAGVERVQTIEEESDE